MMPSVANIPNVLLSHPHLNIPLNDTCRSFRAADPCPPKWVSRMFDSIYLCSGDLLPSSLPVLKAAKHLL
jgi:hypothetical protein